MIDSYHNRFEAGKVLARELNHLNKSNLQVLALPRGGVPVGYEIAEALQCPLDVFLVRKLGVPQQPELAFGAIATGDVVVKNQYVIDETALSTAEMDAVLIMEKRELNRRESLYREGRPYPDLKDKTVILVDDGMATGATMTAAVRALYHFKPAGIIVAVPVADQAVFNKLRELVNAVICPLLPESLDAVGKWYDDFTQTSDDEVFTLLKKSQRARVK